MFEIFVGIIVVVMIITIVVVCVKLDKNATKEKEKKKQLANQEINEHANRIINNPAFQRMMDHCVHLFLEDLILYERMRDSLSVYIYVYSGMIDVHYTYHRDNKITFRRYDMENINNLDTLFAFMEAAKIYLPKKICSELANRGIHNCICSVTWKRETRRYESGEEYKTNLINVDCEFENKLNKW